jgi:hypothetical protein
VIHRPGATWLRPTLLLFALLGGGANAAPAPVEAPVARVLVLGNSLSYVNDMPALFNALDAAQPGPPRFHAELLAAPGGSIADRWRDGVAARELATGDWQVLVLQERGGTLACMATPPRRAEPDCQASIAAHRNFARLARAHGMQVVLLGTWGPDAIWQAQLGRGLRQLAAQAGATAVDAGAHLRAFAKAHPDHPMATDAIGHPSLDASLLVALDLYAQLAGHPAMAVDMETTAAMLPPNAQVRPDSLLSAQAELKGDGSPTRVTAARLRALLDGATR